MAARCGDLGPKLAAHLCGLDRAYVLKIRNVNLKKTDAVWTSCKKYKLYKSMLSMCGITEQYILSHRLKYFHKLQWIVLQMDFYTITKKFTFNFRSNKKKYIKFHLSIDKQCKEKKFSGGAEVVDIKVDYKKLNLGINRIKIRPGAGVIVF